MTKKNDDNYNFLKNYYMGRKTKGFSSDHDDSFVAWKGGRIRRNKGKKINRKG